MYGVPPRGHMQGQTRDNSNTRFFHTKKERIHMCSYIISVVYICHMIYCLKGFSLFYHIPDTYGMHMLLEFFKNKKPEKRSMPITKIKHI